MIKIGSRTSSLARVQVEEMLSVFKDKGIKNEFDIRYYDTTGDKDKATSLLSNEQDDFFTDVIDAAVLKGEVDIAIHSAKDLPKHLNPKLKIYALTQSADSTDAFVGNLPFEKLPKGAKVGTSSELRRESLKNLNSKLVTKDIRGTIAERIAQVKDGKYDGVIVATIALKRLKLEGEIKNIMPWEGSPLQGQLALVGRADNVILEQTFAELDVRKTYGTVTLVGAGPGDPGLITIKGAEALKQADIIFYDYLVNQEILKMVPKAEHRDVGKRKGAHTLSQDELCRQLRVAAMKGKRVVRLKGGDPLIFGRGGDEILYLKAFHIPVSIVPGVSSATAIATSLGLPLTCRDISSSVAFLTAHEKGEKDQVKTELNIPDADTLVFMMGLSKLDIIVESLIKKGWKKDTPVVVISRGTWVDEKIIDGTLEDIYKKTQENEIKPPALIVVGETVRFWKENQMESDAVLYTGTNPEKYSQFGKVIHLPMIEIKRRELRSEDQENLIRLTKQCRKIILTSRYAVVHYFGWLKELGAFDQTELANKEFLIIGETTACELQSFGLKPTIMPLDETSEGLFAKIKEKYDLSKEEFLFPRSNLTNLFLKKSLQDAGAKVHEIAIYENVKPKKRELAMSEIKRVVFTSPSTVNNFLEDYERIPDSWQILSKGPLTSKSLAEAGYKSQRLVKEAATGGRPYDNINN